MTNTTASPSIQESILSFLGERGPRAATIGEVSSATGFSVDKLWSAILRLRPMGELFRFGVDAEEYMVLAEHKADAYVDVPFALSPHIALLYAGFGISAPATMRRTPQFVVLDDDDEPASNRYREWEIGEEEPFDLDDLEDIVR